MLAALSTEAVVLWDDVQEKIEDFNLQESPELTTNGELQDAERILRRVQNKIHDLMERTKAELEGDLQRLAVAETAVRTGLADESQLPEPRPGDDPGHVSEQWQLAVKISH
eukprot:s5798_g4.t1